MTDEREDEDVKPGESKEERFKRLAEPRVNRALEKIRIIGNLTTSQYSFTPEQAKKILMALQGALNEVEQKFKKRLDRQTSSFEL